MTVPNVVGLAQAQAQTAIVAAKLTVGTIANATSTTVAAGNVISQTPAAGATAPQGSAIALTISLGPPTVTVPNVVGLAQAPAQTAITAAKLAVGTITKVNSTTVAAGNVISQTPAAGATAPQGSAVALTISLGPPNVTVPNVVGLAQAQAQTALVAAKLAVGTITTETSATVAAGNVIAQTPAAGAAVPQGSAVALTVSLGPPPVTVPNVVGLAQAQAQTALVAAKLTVGTISKATNATVAAGNVISQTPAAGASALPGSAVNLTISLGPSLIANAGPDQSAVVGQLVTLDGSKSSDTGGKPLTFKWSLTRPADSTAVLSSTSAVMPTFRLDRPGTYVAQLIVNNGTADSAADTVNITTLNTAPVADPGPNATVSFPRIFTLDGSRSSDVDGDPLAFVWSLVSVPSGSAAALSSNSAVKPTITVDRAGTYVAQLRVNDGKADSPAASVTVSTLNSSPVADAGSDLTAQVGQVVTLDGSKSSDVNGDPLTFSWSLLSRPAGSAAALSDASAVQPKFNLDLPGTYVAQLIVNDGVVNSAADTVRISTTNSQPVANAGPDQTIVSGANVQLNGASSSDADRNPLLSRWAIIARPAGSNATLSSPTAVNPTFVADLPGNYVVQLIVNDGTVDSAPDAVVISTINSKPVANAGPPQTVTIAAN